MIDNEPVSCLGVEGRLGRAVHVVAVQGALAHVVHRLRPLPAPESHRRLAHHDQHADGRHLLRHVCGARHHAHPVVRHVQAALQREGSQTIHTHLRCLPLRNSKLNSFCYVNEQCVSSVHTHLLHCEPCDVTGVSSSAAVQAGGGVHDLPEAAAQPTSAHLRLLRAPLPGQDVRRGQHPGRAQRVPQRGDVITR